MSFYVLIITKGNIKIKITKKTEGQLITERKKNKPSQMKKAHVHRLSSHIYCVLIDLMANDKSTDVYFLFLNLNWILRKKQTF